MLAGVLYNFLVPLPNTLIRDFRSSISSDSEARACIRVTPYLSLWCRAACSFGLPLIKGQKVNSDSRHLFAAECWGRFIRTDLVAIWVLDAHAMFRTIR